MINIRLEIIVLYIYIVSCSICSDFFVGKLIIIERFVYLH